MSRRGEARLVRQWEIVEALHGLRRGLTVSALLERFGGSRATMYRDLRVLRDAGVPLAIDTHNGERRYRLLGDALPPRGRTAMERAALQLAVRSLAGLAGTTLVETLASMVEGEPSNDVTQIELDAPALVGADVVRAIEASLRSQRRLRLTYRSREDAAPSERIVEPALLRVVDRQLYLRAFAIDRDAWRQYKVSRIAEATVLPEPVSPRGAPPVARGSAVRVWDGEAVEVAVRIAADLAWLVPEWPLPEQRLETSADGTVVVRARVRGVVEATRWVLGWGRGACVLAPPELRDAVRDELVGALEQYAKPGPKRAGEQGVAHELRQRAATKTPAR